MIDFDSWLMMIHGPIMVLCHEKNCPISPIAVKIQSKIAKNDKLMSSIPPTVPVDHRFSQINVLPVAKVAGA